MRPLRILALDHSARRVARDHRVGVLIATGGGDFELLEPLADAIGRQVLSAEAILADDTPLRILAPGTGKTQTARLWTYARDERPRGGDVPPAA